MLKILTSLSFFLLFHRCYKNLFASEGNSIHYGYRNYNNVKLKLLFGWIIKNSLSSNNKIILIKILLHTNWKIYFCLVSFLKNNRSLCLEGCSLKISKASLNLYPKCNSVQFSDICPRFIFRCSA